MGWGRPHLPGEPPQLRLRASSNGRYLVHGFDTPFLLCASAAWMLTQNLTLSEIQAYLDDQQARGVNGFLIDPIGKHWSINSPNNLADVSPFTATTGGQEDLSTPRASFWDPIFDVIGVEMASRNQVAIVDGSYLGNAGVDGWYDELTANTQAKCESYGTFLGQELGALPNVIHVAGGDRAWANIGTTERAKLEAYTDAIKTADPNHLVLGHFLQAVNNFEISGGPFPWNDISFCYSNSSGLLQKALDAWAVSGPVPSIMGEGVYVDSPFDTPAPPTRKTLRGQYWQMLTSGCGGFIPGDESVWPFGGPNGFSGTDWEENLDTPHAGDVQRARDFFAARSWWLLEPDTGSALVTVGRGSIGRDYVTAAVASDGSFAAIYIPGGGQITVQCNELLGPVRARWFDPTDGNYASAGTGLTGSQNFDPSLNAAGATDKILLLEV
ncbi:MAG TPA: DUF4038 domain-containing protein [Polyangiaceae bacterium]|nr:DUF4038 domain-containing protein [Polyangiaceae bacterium]